MTPVKLKAVNAFDMTGVVGWPSVKVTGSVCVPFVVLNVTELVYVPGVRPVVTTLIAGWAGVLPLLVDRLSHGAVVVALQVIGALHPCDVPRFTVFAAGPAC